jgi:hypothetical protein
MRLKFFGGKIKSLAIPDTSFATLHGRSSLPPFLETHRLEIVKWNYARPSMGSGSTFCSRCQEGPLPGAAKNILNSAGSSGVPLGKFFDFGRQKNSSNGTITWSLIRICLFYLKRGRVQEQGLWWLQLSPFVESRQDLFN